MLEKLKDALGWFEDFGISTGTVLIVVASLIVFLFLPLAVIKGTLDVLLLYAPLWLSVIFFGIFAHVWLTYVQIRNYIDTEYVLLEIKLPSEITQSPLAMESALNAFFQVGTPAHLGEKYLGGKLREESSLEIVSFEGDVRFFIRIPKKIRPVVESQFYSQYPTIEIHETPDYMPKIPYDQKTTELFGLYMTLGKDDPYPIKTYIDFGLDKETDEEYKIDPMAAILEFYGSLGKGEYGMFQIIIRAHQAEKRVPGKWFKKEDWRDEAKRETDKIIETLKRETEFMTMYRPPTEGEKRGMESLSRNTEKKPFDTGIRMIYMADTEHFDKTKRNGFPTIMRTFESHTLNFFKPKFPTMFKYPWLDPFGTRAKVAKKGLYEGYRWRSYFAPPYKLPHFVLSAEELATVYHFPGRVVQTPTIGRITSRKEEAPPNIPH